MNNDVKQWFKYDGIDYIRELGIKTGQIVVDFGCNTGNYSIPAAKVVGKHGKVYAIDREKSVIKKLLQRANYEGLTNIEAIITSDSFIDLPKHSVDAVFIYDMLHYLYPLEQEKLLQSVNLILKKEGMLSVFPKHNQSDWPMWHLANLTISDIIRMIELKDFILLDKNEKHLLHDDYFETGTVLNFKTK